MAMDATTFPNPGSAALRRGRTSITGQHYLVTFTTARRMPHFADADVAMCAARVVEDARLWTDARLLAWVLMPDHWHGLIELGARDDLSGLMQRLKANTARCVRAAHPAIRRVWEKGYHDHALRTEESLADAARYLVMNPVRAGLVGRVGDYPFWDAVWV